eukprot:m.211150 g.211150  ORF g.211150 m.211150 type:complete len:309 (-) comp26138_c0_seq1:2701-3627(-)
MFSCEGGSLQGKDKGKETKTRTSCYCLAFFNFLTVFFTSWRVFGDNLLLVTLIIQVFIIIFWVIANLLLSNLLGFFVISQIILILTLSGRLFYNGGFISRQGLSLSGGQQTALVWLTFSPGKISWFSRSNLSCSQLGLARPIFFRVFQQRLVLGRARKVGWVAKLALLWHRLCVTFNLLHDVMHHRSFCLKRILSVGIAVGLDLVQGLIQVVIELVSRFGKLCPLPLNLFAQGIGVVGYILNGLAGRLLYLRSRNCVGIDRFLHSGRILRQVLIGCQLKSLGGLFALFVGFARRLHGKTQQVLAGGVA